MANVKFYCKELGTFTLSSYATYQSYLRVYPDIVPCPNGNLFRDIFSELEDYHKSDI